MEKKWKLISDQKTDLPAGEAGNGDQVVEILLKNRGIKDREVFFNPPAPSHLLTQLPSYLPDLDLAQLEQGAKRLRKAISAGEKVVIWGDYDVDGVTATAILWQTLKNLGADVLPYIPDRFTEGYGLNKKGIKKLAGEGTKVLVTVDTGIVAFEEVESARSLGLDVIVTDHHLKGDRLPPALAMVHTTNLCGAGVAWILASQLVTNYSLLATDLDLVAIATIADLQSLLGANRSLVRAGLEVLNKAQRPGIAALIKVASLKPGGIGSWGVGWVLAPRINAIGRMEKGIEALRLLLTKNEVEAGGLAHKLDEANVRRHALTVDTLEHAKTLVADGELIVVYDDSWHEGIIGLVAGRLVEEYGRPAVVIAKGEKFSKGSARSVNGVNIVDLLRSVPTDVLEDVGGHEAAAGFTVATENIPKLVEVLEEKSQGILKDLAGGPIIKIDAVLPLENLTLEVVSELSRFEPFGVGNPEPVFLAEKVTVIDEQRVGKEKQHLKLFLTSGLSAQGGPASGWEALWFGHAEERGFAPGEEVNLVYMPRLERYNGEEKITLKVLDLKRK